MHMRMAVFLGIYLSIYGGMHAYIFRKMIPLLPAGRWPVILLFSFFVVAPVLIVWLTHRGHAAVALPMAWIVYLWMGFAFIFFSAAITLDVYHLVIGLTARLGGFDVSRMILSSPCTAALIVMGLSVLVTVYGIIAARQVGVTSVIIPTDKITVSHRPLRVVQISDVHLGLITREAWVDLLVETIGDLDPDLIVSTGDLVDMQLDHIGRYADRLRTLDPRLGKYAVMGNHEVYAGLSTHDAFFDRAGFRMLSNEGITVGDGLAVVGVDDPAVGHRWKGNPFNEQEILEPFSGKGFVLFLKHQPVIEKTSIPLFDLQLSGHSHGGQIFPFGLLTRLSYPVKLGLSKLSQETWFYHSRGTGTWGPPLRVLAPPEVTVIDIVPSPESGKQ